MTGQEVVEVYAAGATQGADYIAEAGDAETADAVLTLSDGTIAVVSNTRANGRGHDVRLELLGSEDSVAAGLDERLPLRSAEPGVDLPRAGAPATSSWTASPTPSAPSSTAFTEVVAGTRTSPCTVADAVEAALIAEAATVSLPGAPPGSTRGDPMTQDINVGIVGFGWMGQVHAKAMSRVLQHYPDLGVTPRLVGSR